MPKAGNWTTESCSTVGTGNLVLTGSFTGYAKFSQSVSPGTVYYSIIDGPNKEAGIGTFDGENTIVRSLVTATLVNGVYNGVNPLAMSLTGESIVSCTLNASAFEYALLHLNDLNNPHQVTLEQARTKNNKLSGDVDFNGNDILNANSVTFAGGTAVSWNSTDLTLDVPTGVGPVIQVGQELVMLVHNDTGLTVTNGQVVYGAVSGVTSGRPHVQLAKANNFSTLQGIIAVANMDILTDTAGFVTWLGVVGNLNTSSFSAGDTVWVSPTVAGGLTNSKPEFPNYSISVGKVLTSHATTGSIAVSPVGRLENTLADFWIGTIREQFDFTVLSDGVTITGTLASAGTSLTLTAVFSSGLYQISPPVGIALTAGTDTIPQMNYVYIPESTKVLTVSTTDWPTGEHIKIAKIMLQSAATTQTDGVLALQHVNDEVLSEGSNGHLSHITERLRLENTKWSNGAAGSIVIVPGTPDSVYFSHTEGNVYRLHKHVVNAVDMQAGDEAHIVNDPVTPYQSIANLNALTVDSQNNSMDNSSFSIVVWSTANEGGADNRIMVNLPRSTYGTSSSQQQRAIDDRDNHADYTIPSPFIGNGFLIGRYTFLLQSGTWTLLNSTDLRGYSPNGAVGAGGITDWLALSDTPNSYVGQGGLFPIVNSGETALEFFDMKDYADTVAAASAAVVAAQILGKNLIVDGRFDFWYEGITQTAVNGYGSDTMWFNQFNASTRTHSQGNFALGQTDVPGNPKYFSSTVVTSASISASYVIKRQKIEDLSQFSGRTITTSFWARTTGADKNISIIKLLDYGPGGSQGEFLSPDVVTLTNNWQKFTITKTIPDMTGKTLSTGNHLGLDFWFEAGSDYNSVTGGIGNQSGTFDIAMVQLEFGSTATEFEYLGEALETVRLNRYFYQVLINSGDQFVAKTYFGGNGCYAPIYNAQNMRATPIASLSNTSWQYYAYPGNWTATTASTSTEGGPRRFNVSCPVDTNTENRLIRPAGDAIFKLDARL